MSRAPSISAPTPAPSSPPPPSESYLSELDGTAPSLLDGGTDGGYAYDERQAEAGGRELNLVSWKLGVNAKTEDPIAKRGFNAISTVLNHPTKRANPLRPSRKPLPPIPPAPVLPKPPPPSFYDSYLRTITPLYDGFIAAQAAASSSAASTSAQKLGDFDTKPDERAVDLPDLGTVPEIWFSEDFNLSNPATWDQVLDSGVIGNSGSEEGEHVKEELSTHLDTLERHLIHEIGLRSTSFFSALSNLQDLHSESASCLSRIAELQESLKEVGDNQAEKGLQIIDQQLELRKLRVTEAGIQDIADLEELLRIAKGLVDAGDWPAGLGYLEDISSWWKIHGSNGLPLKDAAEAKYPYPHLPLTTIPALSSLPATFLQMTDTIAAQLELALSSMLTSLLSPSDQSTNYNRDLFIQSIQPMLSGLTRCGKAAAVEAIWREAVTSSIREGSRKHLPVAQSEEEDDEGKMPEARGLNLAQALKSMDHSRFLLLSSQMYSTILGRLNLIQEAGNDLVKVLSDTSEHPILHIAIGSSGDTSSEPQIAHPPAATVDLLDVLASACELANARAAKILSVRAEQHAGLAISEFVELSKENWDFVQATESLAKRMIVSLRGVAANQARTFLIAYHGVRLTKSAKLVEEEQWTQIDVAGSTQNTVNMLIKSAMEDPSECQIPLQPLGEQTNGQTSESAKTLNVEEKTFFLVKATSESLKLLADYLTVVINLESVVMDVMSRIIEFLKSFNSRTCQVVLGAGAMRSAGLKNITAKHLALASQSLSVVISLIPYIREFIRRHLNAKQAVMLTEFDKLKRDYQEHQNEIHAKLVAIMSDRLAVHVGSLREVDWEATQDKEAPNQYAEMLVKETATLHKVLSKYLATSTVEQVMSEVLAAIVHRLTEEYTKIELKSEDGKKRLLLDATLLATRLSPLAEAGKNVASLQTLVKDKSTPRRNVGQAMAGLLRRTASGSKANGTMESEESKNENGKPAEDGEEDITATGGLSEEPQEIEKGSVDPVDPASKNGNQSEVIVPPTTGSLDCEKGQQDTTNSMESIHPDEDAKDAALSSDPPSSVKLKEEGELPAPPPVEKEETSEKSTEVGSEAAEVTQEVSTPADESAANHTKSSDSSPPELPDKA